MSPNEHGRLAQRQAGVGREAPVRTVRLVRAADQMDVVIELFDISLDGAEIAAETDDAAIHFVFGSQHTAEEFFADAVLDVPTTAIPRASAGVSRVVVPIDGTNPFTLPQLLSLAERALTVQTTAGAPDGSATVLEIPTGLALSPTPGTTMTAASTPFMVGDTSEVWLAKFVGPSGAHPTVNAVHNLAPSDDPFTQRLPDTDDRKRLVDNTSDGKGTDAPITAKRLWLSSAGAFARFEGEWPDATLTAYRHRIATGRDLHVEITTTGYLVPFGHRAAIVEIADRIFEPDAEGGETSVVRLERFLTIIDDDVDEAGRSAFRPDKGNGLPFTKITAVTDETITIAEVPVIGTDGTEINGVVDLVINDGTSAPLEIDYTATDRDGHTVSFTLPATFVNADVAHRTGPANAANRFAAVFNSDDVSRSAFREVDLQGALLAFADPLAAGLGQTTRSTYRLRFGLADSVGTEDDLEAAAVPAFSVVMSAADVIDPIVGASQGQPTAAFEVTLHPRWLQFGNDAGNFDTAFLKLTVPKTGMLGGDRPTEAVTALEVVAEVFNQTSGVGPDLPSADTPWDASTALGDASKLFGSMLLELLIDLVEAAVPGTDISVDGNEVEITYSFAPKLKSNELLGFRAGADTRCTFKVTTVTSLDGSFDTTVTTEATINDFTMVYPPGNVVEVVEVDYKTLTVRVDDGGTLTVDPEMSAWRMGEDLSFLQPVFDLLRELGGLQVQLGSEQIELDASINLPDLSMGMMVVRNIHVDFGLDLPLDGGPLALHTGVGSPASPVEAKIYIFGGSFFVTLDLEFHDPDVDWRVEAGVSAFLELGFDAVVVSAAVRLRIALSFVFNKTADGDSTKVTGAISLEGEVSVLGLVDVSASIVGSVSYSSTTEKVVAKGTVNWAVDTPLGGPDGSFPLGRTEFELGEGSSSLAGPGVAGARALASGRGASASGVPSFGDIYSAADWAEYAGAFA